MDLVPLDLESPPTTPPDVPRVAGRPSKAIKLNGLGRVEYSQPTQLHSMALTQSQSRKSRNNCRFGLQPDFIFRF
jgi:hypothetical protein